MTQPQVAFLCELKSKGSLNIIEYAALYSKHFQLAVEHEKNSGASASQAQTMGKYYTDFVLAEFIGNEHKVDRIIALQESTPNK